MSAKHSPGSQRPVLNHGGIINQIGKQKYTTDLPRTYGFTLFPGEGRNNYEDVISTEGCFSCQVSEVLKFFAFHEGVMIAKM